MIRVPRDQVDEHGVMIQPNAAWFRRAEDQTATALAEQSEHEPKRDVYADPIVKAALEKLFADKCAYCEKKVEGFDVEHFRPAGRVAERKDHPGYYWLTYAWQTLYPSCPFCNQLRRDLRRWDDPTGLPAAGKADRFPLLAEETRAMTPADDLEQEQRLLVDPCEDDPQEYFGYDPLGGLFSINDPVGSTTIEVFHLRRRRLRDSRRDVINQVVGVMRCAKRAAAGSDAAAELSDLLQTLTGEGSPYAGAARYVADRPNEFGT